MNKIDLARQRKISSISATRKPHSFSQASFSEEQNQYIELPVFNINDVWEGASRLVAVYNYDVGQNVTIQNIVNPIPNNSFVLCVRWRVGNIVYRYKLWEDVGEILFVPLYNSEIILHCFILEVWSTVNTNNQHLDSPIRLDVGILVENPMPCDITALNLIASGNSSCATFRQPVPFNGTNSSLNFPDCAVSCDNNGPVIPPTNPTTPGFNPPSNIVADFTWSFAPDGLIATFLDTSTGGVITSYFWQQGPNFFDPIASPTFTFPHAGNFVVIHNVNSGISTRVKTVTVPGAAFSPLDLNPIFWVKGDTDVFVDGAGTIPSGNNELVSLWKDQSGNGYDLTPDTFNGSLPSVYKTNILNGHNIIYCDNNNLSHRLTPVIPQPFTLFFVARKDSNASTDIFFGTAANGTICDVSLRNGFALIEGLGGSTSPVTLAHDQSAYRYYTCYFNTNASLILVNGGNGGFGNIGTVSNFTGFITQHGTTSAGFQTYFAEIIIYAGVLSNADTLSVQSYLANKYGL